MLSLNHLVNFQNNPQINAQSPNIPTIVCDQLLNTATKTNTIEVAAPKPKYSPTFPFLFILSHSINLFRKSRIKYFPLIRLINNEGKEATLSSFLLLSNSASYISACCNPPSYLQQVYTPIHTHVGCLVSDRFIPRMFF